MTTEEIRMMLAVLKQAYPHSYKDMTEEDVRGTVKLWKMMFEREDAAIVNQAVVSLLSTRTVGYTPVIGEICEEIRKIKNPTSVTAQEAWSLVRRSLRNGIYGYQEEYDKLPMDVQKAVGRPEQLREWALLNEDELDTVTASNFRKSFDVVARRQEEFERIPAAIREQLPNYANVTGYLE